VFSPATVRRKAARSKGQVENRKRAECRHALALREGQFVSSRAVFEHRTHNRDRREAFKFEICGNVGQIARCSARTMSRHTVHDDTVDADVDVTSRAVDEVLRLEDRQIFGQRDGQHDRAVTVVYERFDPTRMSRQRTGTDGALNDARHVEKRESVAGRRCVDDQQIVKGASRGIGLLFEVPDLSEDDEFPPAGCRFEELLKRVGLEHTVGDRAETDLDSRVVGQCFVRIDMQGVQAGSQLSTGVSKGHRCRLEEGCDRFRRGRFDKQDSLASKPCCFGEFTRHNGLAGSPLTGHDDEPVFQQISKGRGHEGTRVRKIKVSGEIPAACRSESSSLRPFAARSERINADSADTQAACGSFRRIRLDECILRRSCARTEDPFESQSCAAGVSGLIVTCEECSTSFQLDETRIPASGAQVRCSRCKHAFFLPNPSASQSEAAHAIAEEAAQDPASQVPSVAADVQGASPDAELDEEDWQFSEEIRIEGDESLNTADELGSSEDFGDGLDADALLADGSSDELDPNGLGDPGAELEVSHLESDADAGLALESAPETTDSLRDESNFGSVDDFSSLMEDDEVAPVDLASGVDAELGSEESLSTSPGAYAASGMTDDLGDPESWDLVGNDDLDGSKRAAGSVGTLFGASAPGSLISSEDELDESFYDDESERRAPLWEGLAGIGRVIGWAATIALVAGVLVFGMRSEWTRWAQTPQIVSAGAFTAETGRASWIETSRSGFILVVEGQVRNTGSTPLWPGTVQLALLDASGERMKEQPILAGERLAEAILREAPPDQLEASAEAAVLNLRGKPLAPGEIRDFAAIATEDRLPEGARRVLLEISDSAVAKPIRRPQDEGRVEEVSDFSP
jgi:predicted Zn finger-like uncharacterized protein